MTYSKSEIVVGLNKTLNNKPNQIISLKLFKAKENIKWWMEH